MRSWSLLCLLFYLYILEGIPYGLQSRFLPLVLRSKGFSLTSLSIFKFLYVPWLLKSFYAPLIESSCTKRVCLFWSLLSLLSITTILSIFFDTFCDRANIANPKFLFPLALCFFLYNFSAATQDIAVDGLALSLLPSCHLAIGNTIQVVGYKLGAVFGGGFLTSLSVFFSVNQLLGAVAFVYVIGFLFCFRVPILYEECYARKIAHGKVQEGFQEEFHDSASLESQEPHLSLLKKAVINSACSRSIILLLLVYKLGEQGAMNMLPLMLLDRGASLGNIGFWCTTVGQISSVAGSIAGYNCQNLKFSLVQLLSLLMSVRLVLHIPLLLIAVLSIEAAFSTLTFGMGALFMNVFLFVSGTITTGMFTLMMECTRQEATPNSQASHYTILSTAELLGKLVFSVVAASLTDLTGYVFANFVFLMLSCLPLYVIRSRYDKLIFTVH